MTLPPAWGPRFPGQALQSGLSRLRSLQHGRTFVIYVRQVTDHRRCQLSRCPARVAGKCRSAQPCHSRSPVHFPATRVPLPGVVWNNSRERSLPGCEPRAERSLPGRRCSVCTAADRCQNGLCRALAAFLTALLRLSCSFTLPILRARDQHAHTCAT